MSIEKILITGGCGFIGRNLIHSLMQENPSLKVRVLDNLSVGSREELTRVTRFKDKRQDFGTWEEGVCLAEGDILDKSFSLKALLGADAVVHLAANTGVIPSIENPEMDCQANVVGTVNLLESCRFNRVRRFIMASSGAPLGSQQPPIHEEMNPRPISPYGASKLAGEAYCSAYFGSYGLDTVCLRFGNVYGPWAENKSSVVAKFAKQILNQEDLVIYGDGTQTRDFIHTADLCDAIRKALFTDGIGGQVFQIATHKEHTVLEVAEGLNEAFYSRLGHRSRITYEARRDGEVQRNFSNIDKAKKVLKWSPQIGFEEGLRMVVDWFLERSATETVGVRESHNRKETQL